MVKIFTLDELVNQEIPRREDYEAAVDLLRKEYQALTEEGLIYGALLYGSLFVNGGDDSLIGSDIDQIVVTNNMDSQTLDRIRALREKVSQLRVPAEFHIVDVDTIRAGHHGYERTFLATLSMQVTEKGVIGNNVLDIIEPDGRTDYDVFKDRQIKNLRRLSRDVSAPKYSKTHCTFLGRIINYTIYLAKDMLYLKLGEHATEGGELLPKESILVRYEEEFPQIDASPFLNVFGLRAQYRAFFDNRKPYDAERYKGILDQIDGCYQMVQEFVRANLKVAEKFE